MVEKGKRNGWPNDMVERLLARSFFAGLENLEDSADLARDTAEWSLTKFLSGDIQRIKRCLHFTETHPEIRLSDLIDDQATIIRVCGEGDVFDWFIVVQVNDENYLYSIGTPGNMGTLEPRVQSYSIDELMVLTHEEIVADLDKNGLMKLMNLSSKPERLDIVFSGFMDDERTVVSKNSLKLIPNQT